MASIIKWLAWITSQWTSGLNLQKSSVVVISAAIGAVIGMFLEFGARGDNTGGDDTVMIQFREFLSVIIFDTPISNPATALFIIFIGVALCFIFQMKTALAALYGGATVVTILTTGLPQGEDRVGGSGDVSRQIIRYAVLREYGVFQDWPLLTASVDSGVSIVLCPDDRKPFQGQVDVIWRVYGDNKDVERHELNPTVGPDGFKITLPKAAGKVASYNYELTVRSQNMKTIYTNGSVNKNDRDFSIKVTTETGDNNFVEWILQPNVQAGKGLKLSRCN